MSLRAVTSRDLGFDPALDDQVFAGLDPAFDLDRLADQQGAAGRGLAMLLAQPANRLRQPYDPRRQRPLQC